MSGGPVPADQIHRAGERNSTTWISECAEELWYTQQGLGGCVWDDQMCGDYVETTRTTNVSLILCVCTTAYLKFKG